MNSTDPTKALNLYELVDEGLNGEIGLHTTSFVNRIDDMIIPTTNVFDSYLDSIIPITSLVRLTDDEYNKYKYRPKLLSKDLYGTIELWFLLLKLNRLQTPMDFKIREVRVLLPSQIDVLNRILHINKEILESSRENVR